MLKAQFVNFFECSWEMWAAASLFASRASTFARLLGSTQKNGSSLRKPTSVMLYCKSKCFQNYSSKGSDVFLLNWMVSSPSALKTLWVASKPSSPLRWVNWPLWARIKMLNWGVWDIPMKRLNFAWSSAEILPESTALASKFLKTCSL